MATNRELKAEIGTLSEQLGVPPPDTDRLGRDALTKLVERLREQVVQAPAEPSTAEQPSLLGAVKKGTPAPEPEPAPPAPAVAAAPPVVAPAPVVAAQPASTNVRYFVAEGRLLYTLRGKRGAFKPIAARELSGGQAALEELLRAGDVVTFEQMMRARAPKR